MSILGKQVTGMRGYDTRDSLTLKEYRTILDNLIILFKHSPSQSVSMFIGKPVKEWEITDEYCFFMEEGGYQYINRD